MTPTTSAFDLLTEAWVRVRTADQRVRELSLVETFAEAHHVVGLAGEVPTQDVALLRLLLAITRAAHPDARSTDDWAALWEQGRFAVSEAVEPYLDRHRDRFDLLHPSTPFFQSPGLRTAKDQLSEVSRLLPDIPAGHQYFTTRAGPQLESLSYAEAARWLVHAMAYDASGIKSGAVGDDRVKGGKGYPIGVAWCGWLGATILEGSSLFETLLLNLPLRRDLPAAEVDRPAWEREVLGPGIEAAHTHPTGPVDLLTWQSRRLRLGHDGERVTGVLIANGDPLHPRNMFRHEFMTSWRYSEAQMKALKTSDPVYMPRIPPPDRAVWRGLEALLATTADDRDSHAVEGRWLSWLAEVRSDVVAPATVVRLRVVAAQYGAQSSVIDDLSDDMLVLPIAVMTDAFLRAAAIDAVHDVDAAASALGRLASDLVLAAGGDRELAGHARHEARERLYAVVDPSYRRWIATVAPDAPPDRAAWQHGVRRTALRLGRELVDAASPAAWAGLPVTEERKQPLNAATATNWFYVNLRKALPDATPLTEGVA